MHSNTDDNITTTSLRMGFEESLSAADVSTTTTTVDDFECALRRVVTEPTVGAELPYSDLSIAELPITCAPSLAELSAAETGVTAGLIGIASLGTVAIPSHPAGEEPVSLFPERHVAVVRESDIVSDLKTAFEWLEEAFDAGYESLVFATGPSATGDMGGLVQGVHGPRDVHVVIVQDNE